MSKIGRAGAVFTLLGISACTSIGVEKDTDGAGYTLTIPSDVFASRPMLWNYAARKSGDLCPYGWRLVGASNMDADVQWKIRCLPRPGDVPVP